jgi:hypothetical protein
LLVGELLGCELLLCEGVSNGWLLQLLVLLMLLLVRRGGLLLRRRGKL